MKVLRGERVATWLLLDQCYGYPLSSPPRPLVTPEDTFVHPNFPPNKQVKNFGRSGRTKYTHLVDQDTTFVAADDPLIQVLGHIP